MIFKKWDGVPIEDPIIKEWVSRGIEYLQEHRDENIHFISSGDCAVLFSADRSTDPRKDRYAVRVCRVESAAWHMTVPEILDQL